MTSQASEDIAEEKTVFKDSGVSLQPWLLLRGAQAQPPCEGRFVRDHFTDLRAKAPTSRGSLRDLEWFTVPRELRT